MCMYVCVQVWVCVTVWVCRYKFVWMWVCEVWMCECAQCEFVCVCAYTKARADLESPLSLYLIFRQSARDLNSDPRACVPCNFSAEAVSPALLEAGHKLTVHLKMASNSSCLHFLGVGITDVSHFTQLELRFSRTTERCSLNFKRKHSQGSRFPFRTINYCSCQIWGDI